MKKTLLILAALIVSGSVYAKEIYLINHTNNDILVGYVDCAHGDTKDQCKQEQMLLISAMTKIKPDFSVKDQAKRVIYITSFSSPSGMFETVRGVANGTDFNFHNVDSYRSEVGAWVIDDYGVGFPSMKYVDLGPSAY